MHAVLATVGSAGDVLPVVGLGTRLRARGHRITVLTNPYFRDTIEGAGLELAPVGTAADFVRAMRDPDLWHPSRALSAVAREAILPGLRPVYDYIAGLDPARTVLVASGLALGARVAQERLGFRLVTIHLQPTLFLSAYDNAEMGAVKAPDWLPVGFHAWRLEQVERRFSDPLLAPALNAFRADLGLPPVRRVLGRWVHSPEAVVGLFPDWFAPPQPDWPPNVRLTGFVSADADGDAGDGDIAANGDGGDGDTAANGDAGKGGAGGALAPEVEDFLAAGAPPVAVTFGSAMIRGEHLFRAALEANRLRGRRSLVLTRFRHQLPATLPADVLHVEWAPLARLLPRTAGLVHHGGIGTLAHAIRAGVPQLVVPFAHDQPDNANRVRALGVAERLDRRRFTAERVARALDELLGDAQVRARCAAYAARVDFARAAEEACDVIEAAARGDPGPAPSSPA